MPLFTIILDYAGGTYISQTRARTIDEVIRKLDDVLEFDALVPRPSVKRFVDIAECGPVAIRERVNVWCHTGRIGRRFAMMNIVKTAEPPPRRSTSRASRPERRPR